MADRWVDIAGHSPSSAPALDCPARPPWRVAEHRGERERTGKVHGRDQSFALLMIWLVTRVCSGARACQA
jgi:hypothetical protein